MTRLVRLACLIGLAAAPFGASAQPVAPAAPPPTAAPPAAGPPPLESLITGTPAEGYDLAVRLARRAVVMMQRDASVRSEVRQHYARDGVELIEAAQVVAVHFQTIAAANGYWRTPRAAAAAEAPRERGERRRDRERQ